MVVHFPLKTRGPPTALPQNMWPGCPKEATANGGCVFFSSLDLGRFIQFLAGCGGGWGASNDSFWFPLLSAQRPQLVLIELGFGNSVWKALEKNPENVSVEPPETN